MTKKESEIKQGKVKLTQTHTHEGVEYPPGTVLEIDDDLVQWLVDQGRGQRTNESPSPQTASAQTAERPSEGPTPEPAPAKTESGAKKA